MRLDIHIHHKGELTLASAQFQAQLDRLTAALAAEKATVADLTTQLSTANSNAAVVDDADTAELKTVLDNGGVA